MEAVLTPLAIHGCQEAPVPAHEEIVREIVRAFEQAEWPAVVIVGGGGGEVGVARTASERSPRRRRRHWRRSPSQDVRREDYIECRFCGFEPRPTTAAAPHGPCPKCRATAWRSLTRPTDLPGTPESGPSPGWMVGLRISRE
jgi:hypothetical protein